MVDVKPAIAQLVEHLKSLQKSHGPWFNSGWPDLLDAIRGSKAGRCFAVYTALA